MQLLGDRTEELWFACCIEDDKEYILAIEIRGEDGVWPSGTSCRVRNDEYVNRIPQRISQVHQGKGTVYPTIC